MERATYKVLFYIKRTKILKDGSVPIFARITVNGQRTEFALQKSIDEKLWDAKNGCATGMTKEAKLLNDELEIVRINLRIKKRELDEQAKHFTAHELKNCYLGIDNNSKTILGIFREHNEKCKGLMNIDFAPGTVERYNTCCKHIEDFIKL